VVDRERLDILEHGTCLQILDKKWETYAKKNFRYSVYLLYWYKSANTDTCWRQRQLLVDVCVLCVTRPADVC
jgi:hypothetical protein